MAKYIIDENNSFNEKFVEFLMEKYHNTTVTEVSLFQLITVFAPAFDEVIALYTTHDGNLKVNHPYEW